MTVACRCTFVDTDPYPAAHKKAILAPLGSFEKERFGLGNSVRRMALHSPFFLRLEENQCLAKT